MKTHNAPEVPKLHKNSVEDKYDVQKYRYSTDKRIVE
jgi:hypothetical protein